MPIAPTNLRSFESLVQIVKDIRGPDGCPWDKEQTHETLTQYAIEESFELVEAIESAEPRPIKDRNIKEELGDVLFQVILHSQLATDREAFDIMDVIQVLNEKLVRRHPHVFSDSKVSGTQEIIDNWEKIKKAEKASLPPKPQGHLDVPPLPALQQAWKIGKRTEKVKFDWENAQGVYEKVQEEYQELDEALDEENIEHIEHELGDALFSLAQLARHLQLEPEQVLRKANQRFLQRFNLMVDLSQKDNLDFLTLSLTEKENFWQKAKAQLKNQK